MALALDLETEGESWPAVRKRRQIVIAAAVAAVVGGRFRILEINPAGGNARGALETRPNPEAGHARLLAHWSRLAPRQPAWRRQVKLRITLEGMSYDVGVEVLAEPEDDPPQDPLVALPESVLLPPRLPDTRPEDRICRSPIAGMVVSVEVSPRQWIRQDDPLVIIEAMKMQNTIGAPLDGLIEEVLVRPGEAVKSGQVLFRMS